MKYSSRGHFVCIQSNGKNRKPYLNSISDINTLIQHLTYDFPESHIFTDNKPRTSSIIFNEPKRDINLSSNNLSLSWQEIATAIINGIEYQQSIIYISNRRSLIGYIYKIFQNKRS